MKYKIPIVLGVGVACVSLLFAWAALQYVQNQQHVDALEQVNNSPLAVMFKEKFSAQPVLTTQTRKADDLVISYVTSDYKYGLSEMLHFKINIQDGSVELVNYRCQNMDGGQFLDIENVTKSQLRLVLEQDRCVKFGNQMASRDASREK